MENVVRRRQNQPCVFGLARTLIFAGIAAFFAVEIVLLREIQSSLVDRNGNGFQVEEQFVAADSFTAGSVVSFGANWTLRRGLALASSVVDSSRIPAACASADFDAGACRWTSYVGASASSLVQFQLSPLTLPSLSLSVTCMTISGSPTIGDISSISLVDVVTQIGRMLPTAAAIATSRIQSLTIVSAVASADSGAFGALLLATVGSSVSNATATAYIVASGSLVTAKASTAVLVGHAAGQPSELGSLGFVQLASLGQVLVVGVPCAAATTCLAMLDPMTLSATLATLTVPSSCPRQVAAMGQYLALAVSPMPIILAHPASSSGGAALQLSQMVAIPWVEGALDSVVAVPWTHPKARFVAVVTIGSLLRTSNIVPTANATARATLPMTSVPSAFSVVEGTALQSAFALSVEAATFAAPTLDVFIVVAEAGLRYLIKAPVLVQQFSAPMFLANAAPTPVRVAFYDAIGGATIVGGPARLAGESIMLAVTWVGGNTVAGIAQQDGIPGQMVRVVRNGISAIHGNLAPNVRYASDTYGTLAPFFGAQSYSGLSVYSDRDPNSLSALGNRIVVGTAVSSTELFVWLH